ncbi:DUF1116 domain-containing protein [Enterococcus faecalis]|nr:DUF1116 domain-containing protein [Enterococcus faecalis]
MSRNDLFKQPLDTINVGIDFIHEDMKKQGIPSHQVNWAPPANGDPELLKLLDQLKNPTLYEKIQQANEEAVTRIIQSKPILVGFDKAINVMPDMTETTILHAGPPITYENMCGPMKGAVQGALVFEGLAKDLADADRVARSGAITFSPCHEHDAVGSMAGVTSPNMYVHIIKNETYGNTAFTNLSEQLAKVLRFGANDQSVVDRLIWMRDVLGPLLHDAMTFCPEGIDLRLMLSQALDMGDSAITETYGVGGFAMAAAPAIVPLVGGTVAEALNYSKEMLEITTKENPNVTIPVLDFMGIPSGIDVLKVLETGMLPVINTAIAHKEPGIGMIGAGLTNPPANVFNEALKALVAKIN